MWKKGNISKNPESLINKWKCIKLKTFIYIHQLLREGKQVAYLLLQLLGYLLKTCYTIDTISLLFEYTPCKGIQWLTMM